MDFSLFSDRSRTIIGSCLIYLSAGITAIWGSVNIYFLSYFHAKYNNVDQQTNSIILISIIIPLSIALLFTTYLCEKLGNRFLIECCSFVFFVSQFVIYLKFTLVTFIIFELIIPVICLSVSLVPTISLVWKYFVQKKSIVTAVNLGFLGLGSIIWNTIFIFQINPNNQKARIDQNLNAFFDAKTVEFLQPSTKILVFLCSIIYLLGALLIKQAPQNEQRQIKAFSEKNYQQPLQQNKQQPKLVTCQRSILMNKKSQQAIQYQHDSQKKIASMEQRQLPILKAINTKSLLLNKKCWLIFLLIVLIDVYPTYLLNNFKVIFMPIFNDDHFLAFCLNINIIANVIGTFLWGYLAHRFGNIKTIYFISAITLLGGILGFLSEKYAAIVMFIFIFGLGDKGMETIAGPALVDLFGIKMATTLLPFKGLSLIIGFLLAPIIQLITQSYFTPFQCLNFLFIFCLASFLLGVYYAYNYQNQAIYSSNKKIQQQVKMQINDLKNEREEKNIQN